MKTIENNIQAGKFSFPLMKQKMMETLNIFLELGKIRITFFVAFSTSIGYILFAQSITLQMIIVSIGVFLVASASSALNHFQESDTDALMQRTKKRPIPSGRISKEGAFLFSMVLFFSGSAVVYFSSNITALFLSWSALLWYNIIYTPLKKRNAMAVVPGSVIGALPPVIGWVAAGGFPLDPEILALALFFFIWQIPHFWLLLLILDKDYEQAGFPTLTQIFNKMQLSRITFIWIAALAISSVLIPFFDLTSNIATSIILLSFGAALIFKTKELLNSDFEKKVFKHAFHYINFYALLVVLILSIDKLVFTAT